MQSENNWYYFEQRQHKTGTKLVRKFKFSLKFFILLIIAVIGLCLVGYIVSYVLKLSKDGINGQISKLHDENAQLKAENQQYQHNNDVLQQHVKELAQTSQELRQNVVKFSVQNLDLREKVTSLNETNQELDQELVDLKTTEAEFKIEIANFKNQSAELGEEIAELDHWDDTLNEQLKNFSTLRQEIEQYSQDQSESLEQVMDTTLNMFDNITTLYYLNLKVDLLNSALSAEFLITKQQGFTEIEFKRFLQSASRIINETYDSLSTIYLYDTQPKNSQGHVTWDAITVIVTQMIQRAKAESNEATQAALQDTHMYWEEL